MDTFDKGDLVRCTGAFTNLAGTAIDPSTVLFKTKNPADTVVTYTYPTSPELVKDSVGNYHVDVNANLDGQWWTRWESTGTGQAAQESSFYVKSEVV